VKTSSIKLSFPQNICFKNQNLAQICKNIACAGPNCPKKEAHFKSQFPLAAT